MNSIRKKLLTSIFCVLILLTMILAIVTYFSLLHEMDELYDGNMKEVAVLLAHTGIEDDKEAIDPALMGKRLKGEEEFLIQIWKNDHLQYASHPAIHFQKQNNSGFANIVFNGEIWRYYQLQYGDDIIQTVQNISARRGVIGEIYSILVIPIIVQFSIVAILIWFLINRGFAPLKHISNLIRSRSSIFLDPIADADIPVEVSVLVNALNDLLARLQSALQAQRQLTADAAHELRTPLTAIKLQLDILRRAKELSEKEEALDSLTQGVERSIRLVQQLLELARHEPEQKDYSLEAVDLSSVVGNVADQSLLLAHDRQITIKTDKKDNIIVNGSAPHLTTMISNLVHNAIIYTPNNGHVHIDVCHKNNYVVLNIADDGIGIPVEEHGRIFDRFYRVVGGNVTGSGLGLSIVKSIADYHGVTLTLHSGINGKGTRFQLIFPN